MNRSLRVFLTTWLSLSVAFGGCSAPPPEKPRIRIVVIPKGTTHQFWQAIHAGALKAAKERGGDVEILWEGPIVEDRPQDQQNIVERFTSEGVSAFVLAPCHRQTLAAPVASALRQGIPVVLIDSGLEQVAAVHDNHKYLGYIATDNAEGGKLAADRVAELFDGKPGEVVMLRYQKGSESTELREAGFIKALAAHKNLTLAIHEQYAGATVETAMREAERMLAIHPNVDLIFTSNESASAGTLQAIRGLKKRGEKIKLVGFDGSPELIAALQDGKIQGLVLQDPFDMGYQATLRAIDAVNGTMPKQSDMVRRTALAVVTPANVDTEEMRRLYAPDLATYLPK